ncbi:FAD-dependent monooxygenase [Streptomyces sp. SKN60]|uniref:FAD-dependent oxidoreductase n=1 Tax=Streptomyces sp. SKN60 TaxID=2855506 RepID=UPI002248133D|nr:FAD-dependent oxidoreductase [Streptomyces sp. SKN60]MCX2183350.1 FAD-dependent monooxygenase [Streptomyces sp. SKN60]
MSTTGTTHGTATNHDATPSPDLTPAHDTDVLVVGAGPTGLLLAGDLAAAGLKVTVVERRPAGRSNLTRAFAVHARTLEQLDARGLADELLATGTTITSLRLFGQLSLSLSGLQTRFPFLLITPQYEVEHLLERRARSAGVDFRYGTELHALRQDADGVTAELTGHDGADEADGSHAADGTDGTDRTDRTDRTDGTDGPVTVRARYLVGTDGVRSAVRTALGLPFPGASVIRSIVLADVRLDEEPDKLLTVAASPSGDAFAFLAPFGDGWYRVMGWDRRRQVADDEPVELDELRNIARRALGRDYGMRDARWISRFHSDERQAPAYRAGRVFLAGDAAHVHSPAGGQGMNTGLQDAANLSWRLAAVLRGTARDPEAVLDGYQTERHPIGARVLRTSGAIVRLAMAHTPLQRFGRNLATRVIGSVRPVADRAIGQISGIGIGYGPGTRRVPDLKLREGRLHELLRAGEFVLVTPEDSDGATPALPGTAPVTDGGLIRATWANPARRDTLLVRPDGYTAAL